MRKELEDLFVLGNRYLEDEVLVLYVAAAEEVATNPKTAFLLNAAVKEIVDTKNRAEMEMIKFLQEKFPESVVLKIIGYHVDQHQAKLEVGSRCLRIG